MFTRSAAGRLASEIIGLTPAGALSSHVLWDDIDGDRAVATVTVDHLDHHVTVKVDCNGALNSVTLPRWGNPEKGLFQLHDFGAFFEGEFATGGYTLPHRIRAGWWPDTTEWEGGEFFRATIDSAQFF